MNIAREAVRKMCQVFEEIREAGRKEGERRMSALVRQKDKEIEQKDKEIEQKDKEIEHKDKEIEHKDKELKLQAKEFRLMQEHKDKEVEHKDKELVLKEEQLRLRDEEIKWMKVNIGETVAKDQLNDGSRDISFISRISKLPEDVVSILR